MRVLVVAADGHEAALPAITQTLEYLGTPYTTHIATQRPNALTPQFLFSGCRGNYQAVILTNADVGYSKSGVWTQALTPDEFAALRQYQAQFRVRQVTWYTFPTPDLGFTWGTAATAPVEVTLTDAGRRVFPYLSLANPLPIRHAFTYLARVADASATPLLTDARGHALVVVKRYADGRENLALTFDSNPDLLHTVLLGHGIISWATRGIFIGERRTYVSPQIDDLFLDTDAWVASMPCGAQPVADPVTVRMTGADMRAVVAWQRARHTQAITAGLRLTWGFNGHGTTGVYPDDTLTGESLAAQGDFHWVNHTWDHQRLDDTAYDRSLEEVSRNVTFAQNAGLTSFSRANIITPEITGLTNREFLRAAADAGVRYLVSDSSRAGYGSPRPNIGLYNSLTPSILMIPRRPNNLFFNVATPPDWVAEYNCLYRAFWGRDLTYDEVLEVESNQLLMHMLRGESNPWMFHQANLVAYDGARTLLTDLLDRTLAKYTSYVNLPIQSPTMDAVGSAMEARMRRYAANVSVTLQPGAGVILTSDRAVRVPITGLHTATSQTYAGESTAWIDVPAGATVTVAMRDQPSPTGALPNGWSHDDVGVVGIGGSASHDTADARFTLRGAGADVWGTADAFHFAYVPLDGDGSITARVESVEAVHAWVKAGVMIRESLYPGSAHAFMLVSPSRGLAFQRRQATDGASASTAGVLATAPRWVRLERTGATLSAYESADGTTWTHVGSDSIPMGRVVYAGLAVSSHTTSAAATARFDRVSVTVPQLTVPPPCSYALTPSSISVGNLATSGTLNVTTQPGCAWSALSGSSFLAFSNGTDRRGSGVVAFTVSTNTSTTARQAAATIAGQTFTISQDAAPVLKLAPDVNNDGDYDLVWQNRLGGGYLAAWVMDGLNLADSALFRPARVTDPNWRIAATADMDGDGKLDLVWQEDTQGWIGIWKMNGLQLVTSLAVSIERVPDTDWKIVAAQDFNNDGKADLVWQHRSQGHIALWYMDGVTVVASELFSPGRVTDTNWHIEAAADFNSDGKTDLLWRHQTLGSLSVWFMDGITRLGSRELSPNRVSDINWRIAAVGDVNRDNMPDLIWQDVVNGWIGVWLMDGPILASSIAFNPERVPDVQWRIVGPK